MARRRSSGEKRSLQRARGTVSDAGKLSYGYSRLCTVSHRNLASYERNVVISFVSGCLARLAERAEAKSSPINYLRAKAETCGNTFFDPV